MESRVLRPLLAATGCAAAFALVLAGAYFIGPVARWDATALDGLRTLAEHRWIWVVNDALAHSADPHWLALALLILLGAGVAMGRRRQAVGGVILVVVAAIASQALKVAAAHPRYQPILGGHQIGSTSFPSGHATAAMSLVLAVMLVAPRRWRPTAVIAGAAYVLAVSIALMTQGWHFPSDVVGGYLVAGTISMLALAGLRASESVRGAGRMTGNGRGLRIPAPGARALEVLAGSAAAGVAVISATHAHELASYAATHTTGVIAALAVAVAGAGLIYALAAELDTR